MLKLTLTLKIEKWEKIGLLMFIVWLEIVRFDAFVGLLCGATVWVCLISCL